MARLDPAELRHLYTTAPAGWRSGYAADCKSVYTSSSLVPASISPFSMVIKAPALSAEVVDMAAVGSTAAVAQSRGLVSAALVKSDSNLVLTGRLDPFASGRSA